MVLPAFRLHQIYSIALNADIDVLITNLSSINLENVKKALDSKQSSGSISIIPGRLALCIDSRTIYISGNIIGSNKYIIGESSCNEAQIIPLNLSEVQLKTVLEYIYHMCKSLVLKI